MALRYADDVTTTTYAIAFGANRRSRAGSPEAAIAAALVRIGGVVAVSPVLHSAPVGPSIRRFANAVAIVETHETPPALLARLKTMERAFGRRRGRRWGARPIDLDIICWSGGIWSGPGLGIPHVAFRTRAFVLHPLARIAPDWRDPLTGRTMRQLAHMVDRRKPRT
ncbi:2-amino-4-hydroxy-6-hydroxymethyldihydropteridine diphosphokinase [Sphingomonas bacterium]|uniref:2-amino-4-hydroxy-6- hydroxymethyldihydropteridine diphosphokinase n=1 Tax=Sphingomonas bacterium TaxID=1895847 RepID=UPI0020C612BE|nr:2-amino-4-hydroxy-6-hydroxymethyldihydropteridine diphosphokinase [Sphingomonas bacterium]